jgi:hypothetical protein
MCRLACRSMRSGMSFAKVFYNDFGNLLTVGHTGRANVNDFLGDNFCKGSIGQSTQESSAPWHRKCSAWKARLICLNLDELPNRHELSLHQQQMFFPASNVRKSKRNRSTCSQDALNDRGADPQFSADFLRRPYLACEGAGSAFPARRFSVFP